ncbi:MAG: transglutaminase domain-containing protein, partial [Candidatus Thermoplasmatota archaeon]|nr:transglutaminase domain-containing protein [Candidatus Thermoplasmatota archaeon]
MKVRSAIMVIVAMLMLIPPLNDAPADGVADPMHPEDTRQDSSGAELVLDRVIEVPPGGETRLVLPNGSDPYLEGYIGPSEFTYGKLGQAADLLPDWMRDDFVRNMLKAGSEELTVDRAPSTTDPFRFNFIPSFGDLDGDGDEDMVVGLDGSLYFYKNVGGPGYPVFIRGGFDCPDVISPEGVDWISPEICSIDGDPYGDIIYGDQTEFLHFLRNPAVEYGRWQEIALSVNAGSIYEDHLSPTVLWYYKSYELYRIGIDGYELDLLIGCRNGRVNMWNVAIAYYENGNAFTGVFGEGKMMNLMQTLNYSAPRSWPGQTNNSERQTDIVVGGGDGSLQMFAYAPGQLGTFNLVPNYFQNINHQGPITPAPFDLDGDTSPDLVLGTRDTFLPEYINYHDDDMSPPYWAPSSTVIPPSTLEDYHSVFDRRVMVYNESMIERYLDSIISPNDARYRDEIGFACAYTPPEMLYNNGLANIFNDNAYYIYSRDSELEYVFLKEYSGDDYYTTASYWVDAGGTLKQMEIPMDAYYWGIVHPRITEEPVAYVDPESGGSELPENGGRFWREYLYEHADDSYPTGPEYPSDYTGRYVYYPDDFTPPLLKEELKSVEVLWDLQPYEYPAGFNDAGTEFNYPVGHKVHALEKVSQWVERTLPLNQQESLDDERPNQPVRIAHTHNGNCGELQDLTVAAARCALIPTRGINMPGEDHAWSEFYCGGWQQWDNYWSDGGGVVANDMTYWWGWGNRGGSGIYASMGTGEMIDVGERYRSPEVQGKLTVMVMSNNGEPVDGARVVLLSHWMMDNINVDVGPYQGPPPVTVPFPSIWGYTDDKGMCTFNAWQQEFNLRVISDLGSYNSDKFTVTSDDQLMIVNLQGNAPEFMGEYSGIEHPLGGRKYVISAELIGSYQEQTQFLTGESFRENINDGYIYAVLDHFYTERDSTGVVTAFITRSRPYLLPVETGNEKVVLSLKKWCGIRTTVKMRIKVFEVLEADNSDQHTIVVNPFGPSEDGFFNGIVSEERYPNLDNLIGCVINPREGLNAKDLMMVTDEDSEGSVNELNPWKVPYDNDMTYEWAFGWSTSDPLLDLDAGMHSLELRDLNGTVGLITISRFNVLVKDMDRPSWEGSSWQRSYPWGSDLNFNADLDDPQSVSGFGWLDSKLL